MADTYTNTLGVILMGIGGDNNTWGTNLNNSVFQIFEDAIAGILVTTASGGQLGPSNTLDLSASPPPAGPSAARYHTLVFNGVLTANQTVIVPNLSKTWVVVNATTGNFTVSMKTPSGSPAVIPQLGVQHVFSWGPGVFSGVITVSPFNTNQVQMPNGALATPSYSFVSETNSGWYRAGAQDVRLAVNGADVLQVTGAGAATPSVMNLIAGALQVGGAQVIPPGSEQAYAGINLPTGWLWGDGSAYSRTGSTSNLFAALTATVTGNTHSSTALDGLSADMRGKGLDGAVVEGTGIPSGTTITFTGAATATLSQAASSTLSGITLRILPYGQGDGSTTFNVPDRRGRALFGRDDMNGTAANRLTVNAGKRLTTTGGEETHTLTAGEIPAHTHSGTTGGESVDHTHAVAISSGSLAGGGVGTFQTAMVPGGSTNTGGRSAGHTHAFTTDNGTGGGGAHNIMPRFGISNWIIKL
jgi:microcystin-dependent protein